MNTFSQRLFTRFCLAVWANLAGFPAINFLEIDSTLKATLLKDLEELSPSSIQAMQACHPTGQPDKVQILNKDCLSLIAKLVCYYERGSSFLY
jgi:hypothetical protein